MLVIFSMVASITIYSHSLMSTLIFLHLIINASVHILNNLTCHIDEGSDGKEGEIERNNVMGLKLSLKEMIVLMIM